MRHGSKKKVLNMPANQRKAVIKNLMISMIKSGRIETTLAKAKVFTPCLEKLITKAKNPSLSNTKYLVSKLDRESLPALFEIAKKCENRNGGYTRIIKSWQRYGDAAKTAVVEFVF